MAPSRGQLLRTTAARAFSLVLLAGAAAGARAAEAPWDQALGGPASGTPLEATVGAELESLALSLPAVLADARKRSELVALVAAEDQAVLQRLAAKVALLAAETQERCIEHLFLNRTASAFGCFVTRHLVARAPDAPRADGSLAQQHSTTLLKLRHDAEMLEHLEEQGLLPASFRGAPALFRTVLASAVERYGRRPTASFSVTLDDALWRRSHDRAVVWGPRGSAERLEGGVLSYRTRAGARDILEEYRRNGRGDAAECADQDGWVVVDGVLRPEALARLRIFLVESTFYYAPKQGGHYLMAALEDGLASPIVQQLAEELRATYPEVLGQHHLRMAWAFKYDNSGTALDADAGQAAGSLHQRQNATPR